MRQQAIDAADDWMLFYLGDKILGSCYAASASYSSLIVWVRADLPLIDLKIQSEISQSSRIFFFSFCFTRLVKTDKFLANPD